MATEMKQKVTIEFMGAPLEATVIAMMIPQEMEPDGLLLWDGVEHTMSELVSTYGEGTASKIAEQLCGACDDDAWVPLNRPDSVDWSQVASRYRYMARDSDGRVFLFENPPNLERHAWTRSVGDYAEVKAFASFVLGSVDWRDSLVGRK